MNKVFITAVIIISAFATQSCAESLNEFYTDILIAEHASEQMLSKPV